MTDTIARSGLIDGLLYAALAFTFAVLLVPLGIRLAWKLDVIDTPRGFKIHRKPTPLMGGVAMAAAFLLTVLVIRPLFDHNQALIGLLVGCAGAAVLGFADEVFTLKPAVHFLGQVVVVVLAMAAHFPLVETISRPLGKVTPESIQHGSIYLSTLLGFGPENNVLVTTIAGGLFTAFWIVGMMNTVNFLDGLDGLAGGVVAIAAVFLALWEVIVTGSGFAPTYQDQNVYLPLILAGAILGFLCFNWRGVVFMGDSGSMFLGFTIGALSIFGPVKLGTALLLLIIPITDVAWAIVRRALGRQSFASGDSRHIYHRMLELGLSRRTVVLLFYALCIVLGVIDLNLVKGAKIVAFVVVAVLTAAGAVMLEVLGRRHEASRRALSASPRPDGASGS